MNWESSEAESAPRIGIGLSAGTVTRVLAIMIAFLLIANLGAQQLRFVLGRPTALGLVELFDLNTEQNIPTLFSVLLLLGCSGLFALIAAGRRRMDRRQARLWWVLAAAVLYMAIDEATAIHERVGGRVMDLIETSGYLSFPWVIPYVFVAVAVGLVGLLALRDLPVRIAALFLLGGFLYVSGALGMEMLSARHSDLYGERNIGYAMLYTVEEGLEMAGALVLIHAALVYLGRQRAVLDVRFARAAPDPSPSGVEARR